MNRLLLLGSLLALAACDSATDQPAYPTTLRPLSEAEQASATQAYLEANDGRMVTDSEVYGGELEHLNAYGLTELSRGCFVPTPKASAPAIGEDAAVEIATSALVQNARFTNVAAEGDLRVERARALERDGRGSWQVRFEHQTVEGAKVHETGIVVTLDADGAFCIDGHWYDDVAFAPSPLSPAEALAAVVGDSIEREGDRGSERVVVLTEADLPPAGDAVQSVLPVVYEDRIELRTVWEFPVLDSEFRLYVDATDGEILRVDQNVTRN